MDLVSLGFLLVMILAGGLVALIADKLGRTLGKKRLTLFGLRPRHTATMITVCAGMLIPFITVLFVALVSEDAREWIVQGRAAIDKAKQAQKQVDQLTTEKSGLQTVNIGLKKQNEQDLQKQHEVEKRLASEEVQLAEENRRVAALQGKLTLLQAQTAKLLSNLNQAKLALVAANKDTKAAIVQRQKAQGELAKAQEQLGQVKLSFNELKKQQDELYKQNDHLSSENDRLTSANANLVAQNQQVQHDLEASKSDLEKSKEQLDDVQVRLTAINKQYGVVAGALNSDVSVSRFQPLIFNIGDELARVFIPANATAEQAKGQLANLIQESQRVAKLRGAGPLTDMDPNPAGFVRRPKLGGGFMNPDEQEREILKQITGNKDDLVLVASAVGNTFMGEGVPLDIKFSPNPVVYKRNDPIAEVRINGSQPEELIRQQVVQFITGSVKQKALTDHMIPVSGQAEQFGDVPLDDIVELAKTIHETNRPVRVAALASFDTRRADPLKLHFRVR